MNKNDAVLAIDLGGSKLVVGIVDLDGKIYGKTKEMLIMPYTADDVLKIVVRIGKKLINDFSNFNIRCCGIAIPGLTDSVNGIWIYSSFSGIADYPISKLLGKELNLKCFIENDVNACGLGEKRFGICKSTDNFYWITISNGIGGCVFMDGKLRLGASGCSGELGHICIDENGPPCDCGNRGCLEMLAAGPAISRRYIELCGKSPDGNYINAEEIAKRAKKTEPEAIKIFDETGYFLGKATSAAINILNPKKVILGGGVAQSFDLFYPKMKKTMDKMVFNQANPSYTVEKTALGYDAALLGAAAVGLHVV